MKSKIVLLMLIAAGAVAGFTLKSNTAKTPEPRDGIFLHISSGYDHPQKVAMALTLATKYTDSHDVMLFFDIKGVELLKKNSKNINMEHYATSFQAIEELLQKGAKIAACPMCLKKAGIEPNELIEGIQVAQKDMFFDFTEGRILSLDY